MKFFVYFWGEGKKIGLTLIYFFFFCSETQECKALFESNPKVMYYGHIDHNEMASRVPDMEERVAYLCGPNTFMGAMVDYVTHLGIQPRHILTESFDY